MRAEVVPTATIRPPAALASFRARAASVRTSAHSAWRAWSSIRSAAIGRNVPIPTWSVTSTIPTPWADSVASKRSVKWSPAVGAATAPGSLA